MGNILQFYANMVKIRVCEFKNKKGKKMNTQSAFVSGWLSALFVQPDIPKPKTRHRTTTPERQTIADDFENVGRAISRAGRQVANKHSNTLKSDHLSQQFLCYESK